MRKTITAAVGMVLLCGSFALADQAPTRPSERSTAPQVQGPQTSRSHHAKRHHHRKHHKKHHRAANQR